MHAKTFVSTIALTLAAVLPAARAQLISLPIPVTLDLGTEATCPTEGIPGNDIDATVLAVVTLDTVVNAGVDVAGTGIVGASIGLDVAVCLCLEPGVDIPLITLPVGLEAGLVEDLTDLIDTLDLGITVPGVGTIGDLFANPLVDIDVTSEGQSVDACACPAGATPICSNATCSCACPAGFFYNPVTQECLLAPSGIVRVRRQRDVRQAKRADIEARLRVTVH